MARPNVRRRHTDLQLESVARISRFPIVESGIHIAGNVYEKIKRSNSLMSWSLDTAEQSLALATATALPAVIAFNGPITTLDQLLCKGIDIFVERVPAVNLPPQLMYWNTREYVNNKFVKPVLIRAGSVKQIGSVVANVAVDKLDGALDAADQYVDRYLPPDPADKAAETGTDSGKNDDTGGGGGGHTGNSNPNPATGNSSKAARTIEHGARFSRKLQRRLTRRTLAEARALKEQGTECIHVLLYVVELVATDPKLAMQKAKELWRTLSLPEPENQARPASLEQLLVLCTRETARRVVHLVNGSANLAARAPRRLGRALLRLSHRLRAVTEQALKVTNHTIYGLLARALVAGVERSQPSQPSQQQQQLDNPRRKLLFQTRNGSCGKPSCAAAAASNGCSGKSPASGRLSLIANINIVSQASTSSSAFVEEVSPSLVCSGDAVGAAKPSVFFFGERRSCQASCSLAERRLTGKLLLVKGSLAYARRPASLDHHADRRLPFVAELVKARLNSTF